MKKLYLLLLATAVITWLPLSAQELNLEEGYYHLITDHGMALSNQGSYTNEATLYLDRKSVV